jgi:hypothetical protein
MTNAESPGMGNPIFWAATRFSQVCLLVILAKEYSVQRTHSFLIASLLIFILYSVLVHRFAIAEVDSSGIHFTRYVRTKTLKWDQVKLIHWNGPRLRVVREKKDHLNRDLLFWLDPSDAVRGYQAQRNGEEPSPPPVLDRIAAIQSDHRLHISSGPFVWPYLSYPMFVGLAAALVIAIVGLLLR